MSDNANANMKEYERSQAIAELMRELEKGWQSGEEDGWIDMDEVERELFGDK